MKHLSEEIAAFCERNELASEVQFDLNLSMEELFTNAVRHGGCGGVKEAVRVRLERKEHAIEAVFSDCGRAFDPTAVPAPDLDAPLAERPVGGLGLHLLRRIMHDLTYSRSGEWNCITMRRPI